MKRLTRFPVIALTAALLLAAPAMAQADGDVLLGMKVSGRALSADTVSIDAQSIATLMVSTPKPGMPLIVILGPAKGGPVNSQDDLFLLLPKAFSDDRGLHVSTWFVPAWLAGEKFDVQAFSLRYDGMLLASPRLTIQVAPAPDATANDQITVLAQAADQI